MELYSCKDSAKVRIGTKGVAYYTSTHGALRHGRVVWCLHVCQGHCANISSAHSLYVGTANKTVTCEFHVTIFLADDVLQFFFCCDCISNIENSYSVPSNCYLGDKCIIKQNATSQTHETQQVSQCNI